MLITPRRTMTAGVLMLIASVSVPALAQAQSPIAPPAASSLLRGSVPSSAPVTGAAGLSSHPSSGGSSKRAPSYQLEGAIIGAVLIGGTALVLGLSANDPDAGGSVNVPVATMTGVAIGGILGAIIGGTIHKGPAKPQGSDSAAVAH
jgi:hypothetical protein